MPLNHNEDMFLIHCTSKHSVCRFQAMRMVIVSCGMITFLVQNVIAYVPSLKRIWNGSPRTIPTKSMGDDWPYITDKYFSIIGDVPTVAGTNHHSRKLATTNNSPISTKRHICMNYNA